MSDEIPKSWMPLLQWHQIYHYPKQLKFVEALRDYWEIIFLAGNGTGKSHIFYWSLSALALGIHPFWDFVENPLPLRIKILVNDFEHGYGKIFTDTCLRDQYVTGIYEVWKGEKRIVWFGSEDGALKYIEEAQDSELEVKYREPMVIGPMLSEDPYMITSYPSRDNKTLGFYNGSEFFFQTPEQKKKQHSGSNFDILGCDEEQPEPIYDESKRGLRTAKGGGRILHAFTPPFEEETKHRGPSWTKFKLIDPWERGEDSDVTVIRAAMHENPAISDEFIRKFSKGKTEEQIKIQVYGEYPTWGEMIHPDFDDNIWNPQLKTGHLLKYDFHVPFEDPDVMFEMSLDWHPSKPAGVVWSFTYNTGPNKGDVVFYDEISPQEGRGMTISAVSQAIREHEGWRQLRIRRWGDPKLKDKNNMLISGYSAWEEFRHCGIRLIEANNRNPESSISIVNDYFQGKGRNKPNHPRVFIVETCKSLRHNLKNHYWLRKGDSIPVPDPKFSDYCINLRYILAPKSSKIKKNMDQRKENPWPLVSYEKFAREKRTDLTGLSRYIRRTF